MATKKTTKKKASAKKLTGLEKDALMRLEKWNRPQYDELCQQHGLDPSKALDK